MGGTTDDPVIPLPIIDGHNDALTELLRSGAGVDGFLEGRGAALTLPAAQAGGLAAGFFAILPPAGGPGAIRTASGYDVPLAPEVAFADATAPVVALGALLLRIVRASAGRVVLVRDVADLDRCLAGPALGAILHMEGAEAIDTDLDLLDLWYAAGLRSLGPVWSRPNAFAHGVPFRFPSSPDIGPGLTDAGVALVRRCAELGIVVDLSHLNQAGFDDVARVLDGPLVASHAGAHALCPMSRNLTDAQLDRIGASGGLCGVNFAVSSLAADGTNDPGTPVTRLVEHIRHIADRIGIDHVALGSDYDGATMPTALRTPADLPRLVAALGDDGFTPDEIRRIVHGNWRRVLGTVWR